MATDNGNTAEPGTLALLAAMFTTTLLDSWVVTVLWGWFLVPVGVAAISMKTVVGIDLIVNLIHRPAHVKKLTWEDLLTRVVMAPLIALGVGTLAHWWMR